MAIKTRFVVSMATILLPLTAIPCHVLANSVSFLRSVGDPGSGNGQFNDPVGVAVDPSGNIWVSDQNNGRVEEFSNTGGFLRSITTGGGPWGVAADSSGNIWVAEEMNQSIQKFSSNGALLATVQHSFSYPLDLAVDSSGDVWVADSGNYRIQEFNSVGGFIRSVGSQGAGYGQFSGPCGMDVDSRGNVWATDLILGSSRIEEFSSSGTYLAQFAGGSDYYARDVAVDSQGDIWIADANNNAIDELNSSGSLLLQITSANGVRFGHILGLAFDQSGRLWATDIGNNRLVEFSVVPEPGTFVLLNVGALGLAACAWRKRRQDAFSSRVLSLLLWCLIRRPLSGGSPSRRIVFIRDGFSLEQMELSLMTDSFCLRLRCKMRKILSIGLAAVALSLSRGGIAEADVLYSQPWDGRTGGPSSQTVNGMNYYTVYDDFELRDSGTVTNMQWMGNYYNPDYQSQISQFTIQFWSDNAGQPGHLLETEIIPGTAGETFVLDNGTFREYSYDTDLPISFNAGAGIRYWMSIVPTTQYTTPQWAWSLCHDGTGQCWQRILGGSSLSSLSDDMAFTLNGVPEPSTFVLLAAGALGRAACVWRKRKPSLPSPWAGTLRRAA